MGIGGSKAAVIASIQSIVESFLCESIMENTHYKEVSSYQFDGHKCQKIISEPTYIYAHGKSSVVDVFNPKDLSHVKRLDLDGKRIIVIQEVNEKYIFFGCEGGSTFSFSLPELTRI